MSTEVGRLGRENGRADAVFLGLGQVVGTGVCVELGVAASGLGPWLP